MNSFKKVSILALLSFFLILGVCQSTTFAAAVGDPLDTPEEGWTRHHYDAEEITYLGGVWKANVGPATYASQWQKEGAVLKFNFTGTKIRLISTTWWSFSKDIDVFIDGELIEKVSLHGPNDSQKRIKFEKLDLSYGEHSIEFVNNTKEYVALFGFDTDGPLSPYQPVETNPNPEPTEPDPIDPEPGQPSNPDPQPEKPSGDRAILVVTMTTGLEKEYDLPMNDVNAFINWYDARDVGSGPARFAINKYSNNKGPFSKRTDYVIFDKILTFEVSEYSTN